MVRVFMAISLLTLLLYCSRNCILPTVPNPTAANKPAVQTQVMTRPVGKKASAVPGSTNGAAVATEAEADAAAASPLGVVACLAKTPLTKEASCEESVASTLSPREFTALSWI